LQDWETQADAMKTGLLRPSFTFLALLVISGISASSQTVVTFDDLHETGSGSFIPVGYQGLVWSNFAAMNAFLYAGQSPFYTNGYYYGIVSLSNVAYNANGGLTEISSATNFNFLSAYFTGAWNSNLNIEVQGFRDNALVYDETKVASATTSTPFTFSYMNIDRLDFIASGGEPAFFPTGNNQFAMDNFMFESIPEPSSLLLTTLGAVTLFAVVRRQRH
jgi:hypothetical protein